MYLPHHKCELYISLRLDGFFNDWKYLLINILQGKTFWWPYCLWNNLVSFKWSKLKTVNLSNGNEFYFVKNTYLLLFVISSDIASIDEQNNNTER